jgi:hypothetical protein
MDDARSAAAPAPASADAAQAVHLRDTVRASQLACRAAQEVVRNARAAIATSEQCIRSAQLVRQALRSTWAHHAQLRAELNGGGDQGRVVAKTDSEAAAD